MLWDTKKKIIDYRVLFKLRHTVKIIGKNQ